jgi:hypothetical protein
LSDAYASDAPHEMRGNLYVQYLIHPSPPDLDAAAYAAVHKTIFQIVLWKISIILTGRRKKVKLCAIPVKSSGQNGLSLL